MFWKEFSKNQFLCTKFYSVAIITSDPTTCAHTYAYMRAPLTPTIIYALHVAVTIFYDSLACDWPVCARTYFLIARVFLAVSRDTWTTSEQSFRLGEDTAIQRWTVSFLSFFLRFFAESSFRLIYIISVMTRCVTQLVNGPILGYGRKTQTRFRPIHRLWFSVELLHELSLLYKCAHVQWRHRTVVTRWDRVDVGESSHFLCNSREKEVSNGLTRLNIYFVRRYGVRSFSVPQWASCYIGLEGSSHWVMVD